MKDRLSAFVRSLRTFGQGLLAAVGLAAWEAGHTAIQGGTYNIRFISVAVVTAIVGAAVTYLYNVIAPSTGQTGPPTQEGLYRAARTLAQTVIATGLIALWDSLYVTVTGGQYNPRDMAISAVTAALTAVVAYVHNVIGARRD